MQFYTSQFLGLLSTFIFVMARLAGAFLTLPYLSGNFVNARIKAALLFILSFIIVPAVQPLDIDLLSFSAVITVMIQITLGAILGFVFYLAVQIFMLTGEIISMQAGLSMAVMNDPISNSSVAIVSQVYYLLAGLLFFVLDLPLQIIELLFKSFKTLPLAQSFLPRSNFEDLALLGDFMYKMALQVALPVVIVLLLVQIVMGVMTKAAPQFNIFSVGFAITLLLAILMVWINMNGIQTHFENIMNHLINLISDVYRVNP